MRKSVVLCCALTALCLFQMCQTDSPVLYEETGDNVVTLVTVDSCYHPFNLLYVDDEQVNRSRELRMALRVADGRHVFKMVFVQDHYWEQAVDVVGDTTISITCD